MKRNNALHKLKHETGQWHMRGWVYSVASMQLQYAEKEPFTRKRKRGEGEDSTAPAGPGDGAAAGSSRDGVGDTAPGQMGREDDDAAGEVGG